MGINKIKFHNMYDSVIMKVSIILNNEYILRKARSF